ncbi:MAG: hypothetical protein K2I30_03235 [Clostridia bacterium]|nr:hypothetical protein [Clostridia bacterium]
MKKLIATFFAVCVCLTVFAFAGCKDENSNGTKSGNVALDVERVSFTAKAEVMLLKNDTSVGDYMEVLADNGELTYVINNGFISSFYNTESKVISSTANSYEGYDWAFYIDFKTLDGDDAIYATDYKTYEYGGKTYYSSSNGVDGTPCVEGHTYLFVYEYSNFSW